MVRTLGLSLASGKETRRSLKATCLDSKLKKLLTAVQAQDRSFGLKIIGKVPGVTNRTRSNAACSIILSVSQSPQKGHGEINADQPATKRGCALVCTSVYGLWRAQSRHDGRSTPKRDPKSSSWHHRWRSLESSCLQLTFRQQSRRRILHLTSKSSPSTP